ncbi:GLPGLI family protein [Joostella sp. CR20]|uniref:GLPGLI family protein n=1 Tax=Joostella sp. CR20 TaxID=2804312 RepID=UPI00313C27E7
MKRLVVVLIFLISIQNDLFAQGYTVVYEKELKPKVGNQLNSITDPILKKQIEAQLVKVELYELLHKDGISSFAKKKDSEDKTDGTLELEGTTKKQSVKVIRMGSNDASTLYKDPKNAIYLEATNLLGKEFLVKDNLTKFEWDVTEEKKPIGKYICKKATAKVGEKIITAWYTPSIPISDGPSEYYGLPGLIIQLIDDTITYNALSVQETSDITITKPTKGKEVTKEAFKKLQQEQIEALKQQYSN